MKLNSSTLVLFACQLPAIIFSIAVSRVMIQGYWPDFDHDFNAAGLVVGVLAAGGAGWRSSTADGTYINASTTPWRAMIHHFSAPLLIAWLSLALCGAILLTGPLGDNPGGAPVWTLIVSSFVWVFFSVIMGTGIGFILRGRGLLSALLSAVIAIACIIVSHLHQSYATLAPAVFTWSDGSTVNQRPSAQFLWLSVAVALFMGIVILVLAVSRTRWLTLTSSLIGSTLVLSALGALIAPAGQALVPRTPNGELRCTHESRGSRLCGWPEELVVIRNLDSHWDEITAAAQSIGAPLPQGTTYTEGLSGLPGDHGYFTVHRLTLAETDVVTIISEAILAATKNHTLSHDQPLFYDVNAGIAVAEVIYPDRPDTNFTPDSDAVQRWVDAVGSHALNKLRRPTEEIIDGKNPDLPWAVF